MSKTKLLIAAALAALAIPTAPYVARQIVVLAPPPVMPAGPSDLIPEERLVNWTPGTYVGVPGGIPTDRTQCVTTECAAVTGAASGYKDGTLDAASLLQAAMTSAPANTYVLVPAGTWRLESLISFGASDDSVTLRGAGVGTTIFDCSHANTCISVGSESDYSWAWPASDNTVTAYADSGNNTVLTMAATTEFSAGQLVHFQVEDGADAAEPVINVFGFENNRRQMTRVVSKTPTTLTVFPPIWGYEDYAGLDARVNVAQFQGDFNGLEDFTVDGTNGPAQSAVYFTQTVGAWVKNVRIANVSNYHLRLTDSLFSEVRHSHIDTRVGGGSNGAGILFTTLSSSLIEDNIVEESFPLFEVNAGSTGNVIAYNFIHNDDGNISIDTNHGAHNRFNLYEGNVTTNLLSDGYFGGESEITIYRNNIHGNGIVEADTNSYCVSLKRFTRKASLVGNVYGGPFLPYTCVASLGQPNIGNGDWTGEAEASIGDYWQDWTPAGERTTIAGQLTTRTSATIGVFTLSSGVLAVGQVFDFRLAGVLLARPVPTSVSHPAITVESASTGTTLPALNTTGVMWAGPLGFQELDNDVENTAVQKANYDTFTDAVTGDLGGATLLNSLFRSAKPSWFNSLAWPPVDPNSPVHDYEIIPAGYRFMNAGSDPP